jgi:hypothetical protein
MYWEAGHLSEVGVLAESYQNNGIQMKDNIAYLNEMARFIKRDVLIMTHQSNWLPETASL